MTLRRVFKLGGVSLILLISLSYYGIHRLRTGPDLSSEELTVEGLQEPVEVLYDSMGVPHIFAGSMDDLFFAQGFVHARHRLWQMEMSRRIIQGRLSEIFAEGTLETDRFLRTIGLEEAAEAGLPSPDSPMFGQVESYARGVNAALDGWTGLLPPEFVLLRFRPEPWQPLFTQGMEKLMAWDLSDYHSGLNLAAAREALGDEALDPLLPRYPEWGVTIVDGWPEKVEEMSGGGVDLPPPVPQDLLSAASISRDIATVLELGSVVRASNSWVVGGDRSRSGKPVLANDMHLALNAPNIWFLVGLHAPGYDVVGMSLPGAPGVVAGHTNAVAWGYTNAMVDDSDFFVEEVNPEDPTQYRTTEGWAQFETREEVIPVRGRDPVTLTVRSTHHGPIVTPVEERAGDQVLAFQWVAHAPSRTFQALMGMTQAQDAEEFLQAMRGFDNPHQNVVFADTSGDWGYWMGGHVPVRASGTPQNLPVPGWTGEHDWVGWVPFEEKPHVLAPSRGYIATGNNAQGRGGAAHQVSDGGWFGPYRAQRISELIEARELHDAQSLLAIQMDPGSAFVDRQIGHAVSAFLQAGFEDLAQQLENWDRLADLESTEATLFHTWWVSLRRAFMEHYYGGARGYFPDRVLEEVLDGTLTLPENKDMPQGLPEEAARVAAEFAEMPWGEAHQLTLEHPLGVIPGVRGLFRFGRSEIPRVGGPFSVNVAPLAGSRPPFEVIWGPSQRHVVDLADPDGSGGFILPGGQSGYPANAHSFDQLELWQEGRLWLLPLTPSLVQSRTVATVKMEPG